MPNWFQIANLCSSSIIVEELGGQKREEQKPVGYGANISNVSGNPRVPGSQPSDAVQIDEPRVAITQDWKEASLPQRRPYPVDQEPLAVDLFGSC